MSADTLPTAEVVRAALQRVLSSGDFDASERNRAFLRYVVEETLAARGHLIKGYNIAQSVFKRDPDFDSQLDPVVRIEASRLRRSLERYYLKAGRDDPIQINLPKGGYVPTFECADQLAAARTDREPRGVLHAIDAELAGPSLPCVAIIPFKSLDKEPGYELFALGITEELFAALTHFGNLRVVAANTSLKFSPLSDATQIGRNLAVGFVLQGSIRTFGRRVRVTAQLLSVADGMYTWATSFDRELKVAALVEIETEIAGTIAATLGAPYGAIARFSAQQLKRGVAPDLATYECFLRSYMYRRSPTQDLHDRVRACLENATTTAPDHAESWAQLAYIYLDEHRFGFTGVTDRGSLLDLALAAAQRAVELDEQSAFAHLALSLVHFHRHELGRSNHEGQRALKLNPYNPEVLAQVGWRLAIPGSWGEGMRLFQRGMELDPDPPKWYRLILALDAYRRGDAPAALNEIRNGAVVRIPVAYIISTAILADLGEIPEAKAIATSGCDIFPSLFDDLEAQLKVYSLDPAIAKRLLSSLYRHRFGAAKRTSAAGSDRPVM
jgi:adenylate cyclase